MAAVCHCDSRSVYELCVQGQIYFCADKPEWLVSQLEGGLTELTPGAHTFHCHSFISLIKTGKVHWAQALFCNYPDYTDFYIVLETVKGIADN